MELNDANRNRWHVYVPLDTRVSCHYLINHNFIPLVNSRELQTKSHKSRYSNTVSASASVTEFRHWCDPLVMLTFHSWLNWQQKAKLEQQDTAHDAWVVWIREKFTEYLTKCDKIVRRCHYSQCLHFYDDQRGAECAVFLIWFAYWSHCGETL